MLSSLLGKLTFTCGLCSLSLAPFLAFNSGPSKDVEGNEAGNLENVPVVETEKEEVPLPPSGPEVSSPAPQPPQESVDLEEEDEEEEDLEPEIPWEIHTWKTSGEVGKGECTINFWKTIATGNTASNWIECQSSGKDKFKFFFLRDILRNFNRKTSSTGEFSLRLKGKVGTSTLFRKNSKLVNIDLEIPETPVEGGLEIIKKPEFKVFLQANGRKEELKAHKDVLDSLEKELQKRSAYPNLRIKLLRSSQPQQENGFIRLAEEEKTEAPVVK